MLSKVFATIAVVITGGLLLYGVYDFLDRFDIRATCPWMVSSVKK